MRTRLRKWKELDHVPFTSSLTCTMANVTVVSDDDDPFDVEIERQQSLGTDCRAASRNTNANNNLDVQSDVEQKSNTVTVFSDSQPSIASRKRKRKSTSVKLQPWFNGTEFDDDGEEDYCESSSNEYIPDDKSSVVSDSESECESDVIPVMDSSAVSLSEVSGMSSCVNQGDSSSNMETSSQLSDSVKGVLVPKANNSNFRVYNKKYFCLYCEKPQTKLKKHIRRIHKDEKDVAEMLAEKVSKKQELQYERIKNLGNHLHNMSVIQSDKGVLAVCYRTRTCDKKATDYGPCQYCYGWFVKNELWRHVKNCRFVDRCSLYRGSHKYASNLLLPSKNSRKLNEILQSMKNDAIGRVAKSDPVILGFGEKLVKRYGHDPDQHNYVRQNLRTVSRLLVELRVKSKNENAQLIDFMDSSHFSVIVECTRNIALFDDESNRYGVPSLAVRAGQAFGKCINVAIRKGLEGHNQELVEACERLKVLIAKDWEEEVTINAHKTLNERKRNSSKGLLPLTDDVKLMMTFINRESEKNFKVLETASSKQDLTEAWQNLSELSLANAIVFNRKRAGEVSKLKVEDYQKNCKAPVEPVIQKCLSDFEQTLCQVMYRIEIPGKRSRTVPLLFPPTLKRNLDMLLKKRAQVITVTNEFMFPVLSSAGHIRGSDSLRKFSLFCGAKAPERLRSVRLRKQIATLSQVMNLKDNELDILAQFMGHDVRIHREYYRLPEATLQVAKVSKLLLLMEKGELEDGEALENINTEDAVENSDLSDEGESDVEQEADLEEVLDLEKEMDSEVPDGKSKQRSQGSMSLSAEKSFTSPRSEGLKVKGKRRTLKKKPWTTPEKKAVDKHLHKFILTGRLPGKSDIENCIKSESVLKHRKWTNIKDHIRNRILRETTY